MSRSARPQGITDPGPSRNDMRNLMRWRRFKTTGHFSETPRQRLMITALIGRHARRLDVLTEATDQQFKNWIETVSHKPLAEAGPFPPARRRVLINQLTDVKL